MTSIISKIKSFFAAWERHLEKSGVPDNMAWKMGGQEPSANAK
jgi:hypothetical protein